MADREQEQWRGRGQMAVRAGSCQLLIPRGSAKLNNPIHQTGPALNNGQACDQAETQYPSIRPVHQAMGESRRFWRFSLAQPLKNRPPPSARRLPALVEEQDDPDRENGA